MITEQTLPITKMLENKKFNLENGLKKYTDEGYKSDLDFLYIIIPQIRTLELETIAKAKQEEIDRIVGIIKEMELFQTKELSQDGMNDRWEFSIKSRIMTLNDLEDRISHNP